MKKKVRLSSYEKLPTTFTLKYEIVYYGKQTTTFSNVLLLHKQAMFEYQAAGVWANGNTKARA
jgi:hypothetical protein